MRASASARRGLVGETGFPPRDRAEGEGGGVSSSSRHRSGPRAAPPLLREHERVREVRVVEPGPVEALCEAAAGAEGLLLVDDRRRAPRTALPGPFLVDPSGRAVPAGWLPDLGSGLDVFAKAAARVQRRSGPARAARRARAVGAALPPARRTPRGEPPPRRRAALPRAPLDVRADHPARPRSGPAARARRRHLLRARPAEGLGRVPRPPSQPPGGSGRRAARRALLGHVPDGQPLAGRPLLLRSRRHGRGRGGGSRSGRRRRARRQHALDARTRRRAPRRASPASGRRCSRPRRTRSRRPRTGSSATRSRSWPARQRAPAAPSASSHPLRSSQLERGVIEDELRAIVAEVAEIDAGLRSTRAARWPTRASTR